MNAVLMYTTSWCPYCRAAKALLDRKGVAYEEIDVDREQGQRAVMETRSGGTTVPQIFIGERAIGGHDQLVELEASGELDSLLRASDP